MREAEAQKWAFLDSFVGVCVAPHWADTSQMEEADHCEPTSQMGDNGGSVAEVGLADCKAGPWGGKT